MERYARVIGTGQYIPEIEVTNDEIAARVDRGTPGLGAVVYKFEQNSGIKRRFYAPREWAVSDLRCGQHRQRWMTQESGPRIST